MTDENTIIDPTPVTIGPYEIIGKIGEGGMGVVYQGMHTKLGQKVAIKALFSKFDRDSEIQQRFLKEAKIQAQLSHPNIVNILNYIDEGRKSYIVMEYVVGQTLQEMLLERKILPVNEAVSISLDVLKALRYLHSKGIIHRDIKPSNIIIANDGTVKVTDFGIAKDTSEADLTQTGGVVGTYRYMSPEQILGEKPTIASDVYSLGITIYYLLTGSAPFGGESGYEIMKAHLEEIPTPPWELNKDVPEKLGKIILKSISKNKSDRYQNVGDFAKDMSEAVSIEGLNTYIPVGQRQPSTNLLSQITDALSNTLPKIKGILTSIPNPLEFIENLLQKGNREDAEATKKVQYLSSFNDMLKNAHPLVLKLMNKWALGSICLLIITGIIIINWSKPNPLKNIFNRDPNVFREKFMTDLGYTFHLIPKNMLQYHFDQSLYNPVAKKVVKIRKKTVKTDMTPTPSPEPSPSAGPDKNKNRKKELKKVLKDIKLLPQP